MTTTSGRAARISGLAVLAVAVPLALFLAAPGMSPLGQGDSRMFQTGAALCGPQMYNYDRQAAFQSPRGLLPYFRAPFYALALKPLLRFPFARAWQVVNLAAVAALVALLPAALGPGFPWYSAAWAAVFFPFVLNFVTEHDGAIMLLVLAAAMALEQRGRCFLAGAVLALTLQKPSLFFLLPVVMVVRRDWKMLRGYASAGVLLAAVSFWIVGTRGVVDFWALVARYETATFKMPTARGLAANFHSPLLLILLAGASLVALVWVARRAGFPAAFCFAILTSLFVSPQSYQHDLAVFLLPALYFTRLACRPARWASFAFLTPPVYLFYVLEPPWAALNALMVAIYIGAAAAGLRRARMSESANTGVTIAAT